MIALRHHVLSGALTFLLLAACSDRTPGAAESNAAELDPASADADLLACEHVFTEAQWSGENREDGDTVINRLVVKADGRFGWNGTEIEAETLQRYLELVAQMTPEPTLLVAFEPEAKPERRQEIEELVTRSLHCRASL